MFSVRVTEQWVPVIMDRYDRWTDPDAQLNMYDSSIYRNEMEVNNNNNTTENIYETNDFNGRETNQHHSVAAYSPQPTVSSYLLVPYYGTYQPNAITSESYSVIWNQQQQPEQEQQHQQQEQYQYQDTTYYSQLSSNATPFTPSQSGFRK